MTKKLLTLLLALLLCLTSASAFAEAAPVLEEDSWYVDTGIRLAQDMCALADSEAYIELFIGMGMDTDGFADTMAALSGEEVEEVVVYRYKTDALETLAENYQMDEVTTALSAPAMESIYRRMNLSLGSLLNSYVGGDLWMAIANALTYTETFLMPKDFVPCALFLRYGDNMDAAVLVAFSQTGEETITAMATFVRADVVEDEVAATYLDLMWEYAGTLTR